jgi:hypothetical protein
MAHQPNNSSSDLAYIVNLEKFASDDSVAPYLKRWSKHLLSAGYANTGQFFEQLTDEEIEQLAFTAENAQVSAHSLKKLTEIALVLAIGEGLMVTEDVACFATEAVIVLIALEHLARIGLVEVYRENWSVSDDDDPDRPAARMVPEQ